MSLVEPALRDPRLNPEAGDLVRSPSGRLYLINRVEDGFVYYTTGSYDEKMDLDTWIGAAQRDEVLRVGDKDVKRSAFL